MSKTIINKGAEQYKIYITRDIIEKLRQIKKYILPSLKPTPLYAFTKDLASLIEEKHNYLNIDRGDFQVFWGELIDSKYKNYHCKEKSKIESHRFKIVNILFGPLGD